MANISRIDVQETRRKLEESSDTLLVCAYEDEQECQSIRLENALTLGELESRLDTLEPDEELIFYCA